MSDCKTCVSNAACGNDSGTRCSNPKVPKTLGIPDCPYCRKRYTYRLQEALAENAQLRELVRAAWKCIHAGLCCSDCRTVSGGCTLQSAMRELGVMDG